MPKNFQSTPQPLIEIHQQINQTLLENKKTRSISDRVTQNGEKTTRTYEVNPLQPLTQSAHPVAHPDPSDPA